MTNTRVLDYLLEYLTPRRRKLFDEVIAQRTNYLTVATQDVYQLHNTSAVLRSCDVFGIQNIHIIEERFPKRIDKQIAMGAQKWVDVHRYKTAKECINSLREKGYRIVATSPHERSQIPEDFSLDQPSALFFGTEKEGLSEEILSEADTTLHIPMVGFTESLNISVSAAIILHVLTERLRKSDFNWKLAEKEKMQLKFEWTKKSIKNSEQIIERFLNQ